MSGGAVIRVRVGEADFDAGAELAALAEGRDEVGGVACFVGRVRGPGALTLEHYPAMTERACRGVADEAVRRWPLAALSVVHRVGRLEPGAQIVLVAAASAHRAAALEAVGFVIDWLKTRAPFWKREEGGGWVEARAEDEAAAGRWG